MCFVSSLSHSSRIASSTGWSDRPKSANTAVLSCEPDTLPAQYSPRIVQAFGETMKLFVIGATGYIGGSVAQALMGDGHNVIRMARSRGKAVQLQALGIRPR